MKKAKEATAPWQVITKPLAWFKPNPKNPRKWTHARGRDMLALRRARKEGR